MTEPPPAPEATGDTYVVVANASAGSADDQALDAAVAVLERAGSVRVARTGDGDELADVVSHLAGATLVVAGGDGSLHAVVDHLWRTGRAGDVTVALVPLGTGNDMARGLDLPLDPATAATAITRGTPRRLDLLEDDTGAAVVNAVHVGLGAEAAATASGLKERLGPLAYPVGALVAGVRERGWALEVTVDGAVVSPPSGGDAGEGTSGALLMAGVGNGPSIGGGTRLFPTAVPDDGLLDVVVVGATGPAARIAFAAALRKGTHLGREDVAHVRGREVRVTGDAVVHNADGELSEEVTERSYRLVPDAWWLVVAAG